LVVLDRRGHILRYNPACEEMTGYTLEEVRDKPFWDYLLSPEDVTPVKRMFESLRDGLPSNASESSWVVKGGRRRLISWSHTALRGEGEGVEYILSTGLDITDTRRAEEERAALQAQVIEAQRAVLRELSTPLIPIADRVVVVPLIGTIDEQRAEQMLEALLAGVSTQRAETVIIDITGVRAVDTQVAAVFVRAAKAVRLLGAEVILTGIKPQIAETLVRMGVDLSGMRTLGSLQVGIAHALKKMIR
jgi:rsbT co-antagonist protein RsbR